jgi:threonyl-tRNA synthetase
MMMAKIELKFPDGSVKEFEPGITPYEIAKGISYRLAKEALGAVLNGEIWELNRPITESGEIRIVTFNDPEGKHIYWHSSAHLMAQAVKRLWPKAKLGIGPPIEDGFYYDIDVDHVITPEDFPLIEKEMEKIVNEGYEIRRRELQKEEAMKLFKQRNEDLKLELIEELDEQISAYEQGEFIDLCRGPHLPDTKKIGKNFKILSVAGAYWRGDEKNKMLQRLYATAYPKKSMLEEHLKRLEEAKKRDHRKLGRELDLFSIQESIGNGLILWHPKGARIRRIIEDFWIDEHFKNGYELINTPHIAKFHLWETSGHAGFYSENMFSPIEVEEVKYQLKPMNCPFHITIYKSHLRSYRDLPIRYAELGTVYRYERSGVLHGLMRVRGFTQDDAHIFCTPENLSEEIKKVIDLTLFILRTFGFDEYSVYLSTRPEKFVGSLENWELATNALKKALEESGLNYEIDPGEGVFYGPKIDVKIKDSLGRYWQCSTIQVDFNLPERFDVTYIGADGQSHKPIMIHRALMGSLERFFGILIEHYAGLFPLWLAPVQGVIIPITENQHAYADEIHQALIKAGFRFTVDKRNEKMGYKIREAETQKIPYMLIIGQKEAESRVLSVRHKGEGDIGSMTLEQFMDRIAQEVREKKVVKS